MDMSALTGQDRAFLAFERPGWPMTVAALAVFEAGPLGDESGVDLDTVAALVAERCHAEPRLMRRLGRRFGRRIWEPTEGDPRDRVATLVLNKGATLEELRLRVAPLLDAAFSRSEPLWRIWVAGPLEGDHFALVLKVHHAMVDGVAGFDLFARLLDGLGSLAGSGATLRKARTASWRRRLVGLASLVRELFRSDSPVPELSGNGGTRELHGFTTGRPDRRDGRRLTLNESVLAAVSKGLDVWLRERGHDPAALSLRALCPVNLRAPAERGRLGNRLGALFVPLALGARDGETRAADVRSASRRGKRSRQAWGVELLGRLADALPPTFPRLGLWLADIRRLFSVVITNVPGPRTPLHLGGAELVALEPYAPLFPGHACSIAVMSYRGRLYWGVHGMWAERTQGAALAEAIAKSADA